MFTIKGADVAPYWMSRPLPITLLSIVRLTYGSILVARYVKGKRIWAPTLATSELSTCLPNVEGQNRVAVLAECVDLRTAVEQASDRAGPQAERIEQSAHLAAGNEGVAARGGRDGVNNARPRVAIILNAAGD